MKEKFQQVFLSQDNLKKHHLELVKNFYKYRELLIVFYVSIRSKNIEAALSLEKLISEYSYLFHELLKNFLPQTENEEKFIHSLIIRIYRIQKKILQIWEQNQQIFQDAHFQKQVDLVIKKYLQEKGL